MKMSDHMRPKMNSIFHKMVRGEGAKTLKKDIQ